MKSLFILLFQIASISLFAQLQPIGSGVFHWNESPIKNEDRRTIRTILHGTTAEFSYFEIQGITLEKGFLPQFKLAVTDVEQLIIVKEGLLKCHVGDSATNMESGSVLLIPPGTRFFIANEHDPPASFYLLSFTSIKPMDMHRSEKAGGLLMINEDDVAETDPSTLLATGRATQKYFDRPTAMCENYEMHITTLTKKGPSHAPHQHVDTEIILVISGDVEMTIDGKEYKGSDGDLFIAESGKMHGVSNASDKTCKYFAFKWR